MLHQLRWYMWYRCMWNGVGWRVCACMFADLRLYSSKWLACPFSACFAACCAVTRLAAAAPAEQAPHCGQQRRFRGGEGLAAAHAG